MDGNQYSIGIDFGTLSGRALLLNLQTGEETACAVKEYAHGVMDETLPDGTRLGIGWALQHPADYWDVLREAIPAVMQKAGVRPEQVVGVGIDFTSCTVLPVKADGTPLCFLEEFKNIPQSYVMLWKHHAAQEQANRINEMAEKTGQDFLQRYGGKTSSEWVAAKAMQIAEEAPQVYRAMDRFLETADWIVWQLTGKEMRSCCTAGYKAMWHKQKGYPSKEFFKSLNPMMENFVQEKLSEDIYPLGTKAGEITTQAAALTGLLEGTAVAVGNVDAHVCVPALGITQPGKMLMIMGTSTCHMLISEYEKYVPGMCGVVEDGILPGYFGYEAGQCCVGDHFAWFAENYCPEAYEKEAQEKGISTHQLLAQKAALLRPGESGLLALDWWNGNRSILSDADLTGVFLGMNLNTKPEEMYRALIEATAYGTRMIVEAYIQSGLKVDELYATGGIPEKNPFIMQIYADVTNREIKISATSQGAALGAAMFGAVAAGQVRGGFDSIAEVAGKFGKIKEQTFRPIPENVRIYEKLFAEYALLHDYFAKENHVMKRLKNIARECRD